jgi:arabinan endo-1,5-alpha-L-arabinosidase
MNQNLLAARNRNFNWRHWGSILIAVLAGWTAETIATAQPDPSSFRLRVHDPATIVRNGDDYWTFATGDGIKSLRSTNLTDWVFARPVLPANPDWTTNVAAPHRDYFWAPDVIFAEGRYLLYYSVSSWGKNTSAIGLATNVTLNPADPKFKWTDTGIVVRSFATNAFNTIDPALTFDAEGRLWMAFGSFWSGIKLIELDPKTGHRIAPDSPMYALAFNDSIEAAFIQRRGANYFLFVNWGQCCQGTNSTYEIRIGRSDKITGPYLDRAGKNMLDRGGTLFLESKPPFYGPGHAGIINVAGQDWFSCHYYDGNNRGRSRLWVGKLNWNADGWPIPPVLTDSTRLYAP